MGSVSSSGSINNSNNNNSWIISKYRTKMILAKQVVNLTSSRHSNKQIPKLKHNTICKITMSKVMQMQLPDFSPNLSTHPTNRIAK